MSEHFEGFIELDDSRNQDDRQGKSLNVLLKLTITKSESDILLHKELIDFMNKTVKVSLTIETDKRKSVVIEGEFWMIPKKLKKQYLLMITITVPYDKVIKKKLVDLEGHNLKIIIDLLQKGLDGLELEEDSEDDE